MNIFPIHKTVQIMHFLELVLFRFLLGRILLTIHQHDFQPLVLEYCFSIQRFSVPRDKDHTGADFLFSGIVQQQLSQLAGDQDRPDLGFAIHDNFAVAHSLHRKNFSSDTRIPVLQMVCITRRSCSFFSAAFRSRSYSALVSSFSSAQ